MKTASGAGRARGWGVVGVVGLVAGLLVAQGTWAQAYPNRAIRLVNPYAAGGPFDLVAREVARPLSELLGQQIVVESRPGGGATVGAAAVAKSPADGYTLLMSGSPSHVIVPAMMTPPPYDGLRDFSPVAMIATVPNLIVARTGLPVTSLNTLIAQARANPGKLTYGSPGNGSIGHLATELLKKLANIDMTHVPYKGAAPAVTDLLGGQIDLAMVNISAVLSQVRAGKLRAIAMGTRNRIDLLAELPTIEESGFQGYDAGTWYGIFGPAQLPAPVTGTLHQALVKVMQAPDLRTRLREQQGAEVTLKNPAELAAHLQKERDELVPLIRSLGLKPE